jgi:pimeloyl-ACP methyl ester carboxylesterase
MATRAAVRADYLDIPGGRLYYEVQGDGEPLVLIHAGVADLRMWDPQMDAFAEHYKVIRYDERFCGRSRTDEVEFSRRKDLSDLLDHVGARRAAILGCSRGGQLAIDFTLENPDRVAALVVVAPGVSGLESPLGDVERPYIERAEPLWEAENWDGLVDVELEMWVDGPGQSADRIDPAVRERVREMDLGNYKNHTENLEGKSQQLDPPAAGRLGEIGAPTLVVAGDLDMPSVLSAVDAIERDVPGARKAVIPGTAHMLNMEKPAEFNRLVLDFLEESGTRSGAG